MDLASTAVNQYLDAQPDLKAVFAGSDLRRGGIAIADGRRRQSDWTVVSVLTSMPRGFAEQSRGMEQPFCVDTIGLRNPPVKLITHRYACAGFGNRRQQTPISAPYSWPAGRPRP